MASACVNNAVGVSTSPPGKFSSFAWLSPPRLSFTRHRDAGITTTDAANLANAVDKENTDLNNDDDDDEHASDFEFRLDLDDPVPMLPADELISDGKLMTTFPIPLSNQPLKTAPPVTELPTAATSSGAAADLNLFSPRAPRCASRWKEIFGLKKLHHNSSLKTFLYRTSKSSSEVPLLRDSSDCETSLSISSRLSLSSSSSGHDQLDDFPRLSLDTILNPISLLKSVANSNNPNTNPNPNPPPRIRLLAAKPRPAPDQTRMGRSPILRRTAAAAAEPPTNAAVSFSYADSPRMNPAGKIVFHSLERSSSSPGSFNGGPRLKHRGMERSYSANVRVAPVLNVPVCSLSKSGNVFQLFSNSNGGGTSTSSNSRSYQSINNNSSSKRNRS